MHRHSLLFLMSLLGVVLTFTAAAAQTVVPPSAQPGVVGRELGGKERPPARLETPVYVPRETEKAARGSTRKEFVLKAVEVDKSTVYSAESLRPAYEEYVGKMVSFADLGAIADNMTRRYREDGYLFSRVILKPQKIAAGTVHFEAIEGRIVNVELAGDVKDKGGLIRKLSAKIRASGPANSKVIERYLLLINDLPGIKARSLVRPSKTAGGGDLVINLEERRFEGSASFDNRGSKPLGPYRGELVGAFNSLLGLYDRTTLRGLMATDTDELKYGEITHEQQLGAEGLRLKGRIAAVDTAPGGRISGLDISGKSVIFDLEALYPLIRGRQLNLNLLGGMNVLNSKSDVMDIKVADDHVRHVRMGGHLDFTDDLRGVNQLEAQVTHGLKIFGATDDGLGRSRANGKHDFLRANATVSRIQDLFGAWSLFLSVTGQASGDPLLVSEEFTAGGGSYGRAYDAGEISGDKGYAGLGELRYGRQVDGELLKSYQGYAFYDAGRVFNIDPDPLFGEAKSASLASAGGGLRLNFSNGFSGYLEAGKPLTRKVASEDNRDARVFFNLLKRF